MNEYSSFPQVTKVILRVSPSLANSSWRHKAPILKGDVINDWYFKMSSLYPLKISNRRGKRGCFATMETPFSRGNPNLITVTPSHSLLKGRGHYCHDGSRLFLRKSHGRFHPRTEPRAACIDMARVHQPLERGGPAIRNIITHLLWQGIANGKLGTILAPPRVVGENPQSHFRPYPTRSQK